MIRGLSGTAMKKNTGRSRGIPTTANGRGMTGITTEDIIDSRGRKASFFSVQV